MLLILFLVVCTLDGIIYQNASSMPVKEECDESCFCADGEIICNKKQCQLPPSEPGMTCIAIENEGECCPSYECVKDSDNAIEVGSLQTTLSPTTQSQITEEDKVSTIDNIEMEVFGDKEDVTATAISSSTEEVSITDKPLVDTTMSADKTTISPIPSPAEPDSTSIPTEEAIISEVPVEQSIDIISTLPTSDVQSTTVITTLDGAEGSLAVELEDLDENLEEDNLEDIDGSEKPPSVLPSVGIPTTTTDEGVSIQSTTIVDTSSSDAPPPLVDVIDEITDEETETTTGTEDIKEDLDEISTILSEADISSNTITAEEMPSSTAVPQVGVSESSGLNIPDSEKQTTTLSSSLEEDSITQTEITIEEGSGDFGASTVEETPSSSSAAPPEMSTEDSGVSIPDTLTTTASSTVDEDVIAETEISVQEESESIDTSVDQITTMPDTEVVSSTQTPIQPSIVPEEVDTVTDSGTTVQPDSSSTVTMGTVASSCLLDGVEYNEFEPMPSSDPCQLCFCQSGVPLCATEECPKPKEVENCIPLDPPEGKCCPEEYSCGK